VPLARQRGEHDVLAPRVVAVASPHQPEMAPDRAGDEPLLRDGEFAPVPALPDFAQQRLQDLGEQLLGRKQRDRECQDLRALVDAEVLRGIEDPSSEAAGARLTPRDR